MTMTASEFIVSNAPMEPPVRVSQRAGKWPVLDLTEVDASDVCGLFEHVFGQSMSLAFHSWKYAGGRGRATGIRDDAGRLVAHFGGTLRVMQWGAQRVTGVQGGDSMVAPEVRDVFARFGPFGRVARRFSQQYVGIDRLCPICFGFPNVRAELLGRRLGLYWPVTKMLSWTWSRANLLALAAQWPLVGECRVLSMADAADRACVDGLAVAMEQRFIDADMLWPLRGGDWWRHRYAHHPHNQYCVYAMTVPGTATPWGAFVLKKTNNGGLWELMDWVGPQEFSAAVVAHASLVVGRDPDCGGLEVWGTEAVGACLSPAWTASAKHGVVCAVTVNGEHLLGRSAAPLQHTFWLTSGDTDFR